MKNKLLRLFLSLCFILYGSNLYAFPFVSGGVGGGGDGVNLDTDCDQAAYYALGTLCQDTDDGKLYKGTGAAVVELATGASGDMTKAAYDTDADDVADKAEAVKSPATTGVVTITGPGAGTTRVKTVRDANDTVLELGGSYTPTATWNWTTATVTWPTFNQNTSGSAASATVATALAADPAGCAGGQLTTDINASGVASCTSYAANVLSLLGAADYAAMKTLLSLNSVENTALSTWAGTTNITTLGTIAAGTWSGAVIAKEKIATDLTTANLGPILTFGYTDLVDMSAITMTAGSDIGFALPVYADVAPATEKYYMAYDASNNAIMVREAGGWVNASAGSGAAPKWNAIQNPDANDEIDFGAYTIELNVTDFQIGDGSAANAVIFTGGAGGQFKLGSAGVQFTGNTDGGFTMLGLGDGADEDLTISLDSTNAVVLSSTTGVTTINMGSIGLITGAITASGDITSATGFVATATALPSLTFDDSDSVSETSDAKIYINSTDSTAGAWLYGPGILFSIPILRRRSYHVTAIGFEINIFQHSIF